MVNQIIFEGLKSALERKQDLKQAMMSFYNAGYKKEEIEDAARTLLQIQYQQQLNQQNIQQNYQSQKPKQLVSQYMPATNNESTKQYPPMPSQKISSYMEKQESSGGFVIILVIILIALLGFLGAIIIFREQLINLFSK